MANDRWKDDQDRYSRRDEGRRRDEGDRYGDAHGRAHRSGMTGSWDRGESSGGYGAGDHRRSHRNDERRFSGGGDRDRDYGRDERTSFSGNAYRLGSHGADQGYRGEDQRRDYGEERGFWHRTADEVSSWFGDDDARRRRAMDERRRGEHRGRGPRNYVRSDERIREDVNDRLTDDPHIDASEIEVTVQSREVTLTGTVNSRFEKRHAEDIAESVSGVTHVQNNLRVSQSTGTAGPIGAAASTTTGVSMEAGLPTGAASADLSRGSLQRTTGVSETGSPAAGSRTGPQGTGLGGVEVGPQGSRAGTAERGLGGKSDAST